MALNKYMHPRNIYKNPPSFKQLALDYPEFRSYVKQDITGKVSLDFKNPAAVRALNCTLLKRDFGLDVEIPLDKMIPTVPLRLNYILWIEDLLSIMKRPDVLQIRGVDIGTGASCIYSLLGAKKGWRMIATDIDEDSIRYARQNVSRNGLDDLITVRHVSEATVLKEAVPGMPPPPSNPFVAITEDRVFDFCMCNPPFFATIKETNPFNKARRPDQRPLPRNAFTATPNEVVFEGGEVKFLAKMIDESREMSIRYRVYTSMIGHKSSLPPVKKLLREAGVMSFKQTEFCQGKTTRWALAWTYRDIDLRSIPEQTVQAARRQKPKPLHYVLEEERWQIFKDAAEKLKALFLQLDFETKTVKETKDMVAWQIIALEDTWSHQRRKRREQQRLNSEQIDMTADLVSQMQVHSPKSPNKREHEEDSSEYYVNCKRQRLAEEGVLYFLKASVILKKDQDTFIELIYTEGTGGKESIHQVLQYLKNHMKVEEPFVSNF